MGEIIGSLLAEVLKPICSCCWEKVGGFPIGEMSIARNAKSEIENLERRLQEIQPIIRDAWNRSKEVKDWACRMNDVTYDAHDAVDLFRVKSHLFTDPGDQSKVRKIFNSIYNFRKKWGLLYNIGTKVRDINERLDKIFEEKDRYGLQPLLEESTTLAANSEILCVDRRTTSGIYESEIVGRKEDEETVIKWLMEESNAEEESSASGVAIVGMGGVGKTALAKTIFQTMKECHKERFDKFMWVCVAEKPKLLDLLKMILEGVDAATSSSNQSTNEDVLSSKIRKHLENKRFLLVLDDVWDLEWWDELKSLWKSGCRSGSKVIITTREGKFAKEMDLAHSHELKCLGEQQSWQLLMNKVLKGGESEEVFDEILKDVGRKIVRKCGGLPLALNVVGSVLRHKDRSRSVWQDVLDSPVWKWKGAKNDNKAFAAIALSFMSIPFQSKQCLLYCCLFPKDFPMEKPDLARCWVAEGFISKENGVEIEVTAERCFDDLVGRSLIQKAHVHYGSQRYTLHDLVHDFAVCLREKEVVETGSISHLARYVSSVCSSKALQGLVKLRGLVRLNAVSACDFTALKWLRMLDLRGGGFKELPESIGDLVLLRYLNLSWTHNLEQLPESIVKLHELQTLDLRWSNIRRLPGKISKLSALRHLDIEGTRYLWYLPSGIGKLTCLQTLPKFVVGNGETSGVAGCSLWELQELNNLRGELRIEHLERVSRSQEADRAQLKRKEKLQKLQLCCDQGSVATQEVEEVYEGMEPPAGIEEINIKWYPGKKCPTWMNSHMYSCLRSISIKDCYFLENLPNFGFLPNPESLWIDGCKSVEVFDTTVDDHDCHGKVAFPKLKSLLLQVMESLKEWRFDSNMATMPCLEKLWIRNCPKLRVIPFFSTLTVLQVDGMDEWEGWPMEVKDVHMPRLRHMTIVSCKMVTLTILPDGLHCPLLEEVIILGCGTPPVMWVTDALNRQPPPNLRFLVLASSSLYFDKPYGNKMMCGFVIDCAEMSDKLGELMLRLSSKVGYLAVSLPLPGLDSLPLWIQQLEYLEWLTVEMSPHLINLPHWLNKLSRLRMLKLLDLPELVEMPAAAVEGLHQLQQLQISSCPKLRSLPDELWRLPTIQYLKLTDLAAESWVMGTHMPSLKRMRIKSCKRLKLLPDCHCPLLEEVVVEDCGTPLLLCVMDLLNHRPLPNLRLLILSSSTYFGPRVPFFGNKVSCGLEIDCEEMSDKLGELMPRLSSQVGRLEVKLLAPALDSLPPWIQLLHQLELLTVENSSHLTRLPPWLGKLSQLQTLGLSNLPELAEMPAAAVEGLRRLQYLWISSCPKLSALPDELWRLPRLQNLWISASSLLTERYRSEEDRQEISHIPRVRIE